MNSEEKTKDKFHGGKILLVRFTVMSYRGADELTKHEFVLVLLFEQETCFAKRGSFRCALNCRSFSTSTHACNGMLHVTHGTCPVAMMYLSGPPSQRMCPAKPSQDLSISIACARCEIFLSARRDPYIG